jgi:hypothetical protein
MLVPLGSEEDEYHAVEQVCVPFLNIDTGFVDIKKRAMLSDQVVWACFRLRLADGYR